MAGSGVAIDVKRLFHAYFPGTAMEVPSLKGVDLRIEREETIGIIGPAGSGKSTLLQHMNGLIRPRGAGYGDVVVLGLNLSDPSIDMRTVRQKVALLFQNPEDQLFERYVGDDIAFGPRNLGLSKAEVRERVQYAMDMVGLPFSFKDRITEDLSGGEKRRAALAGVLSMEPEVLVLDEPTAGIDPQGRRHLMEVLGKWLSRAGRSMVIVSHTMEDIAELADRVYVLVSGQVLLHGSTAEVFSSYGLLKKYGLGIPTAVEITRFLKKEGFEIPPGVVRVKQAVQSIQGILHGRKI